MEVSGSSSTSPFRTKQSSLNTLINPNILNWLKKQVMICMQTFGCIDSGWNKIPLFCFLLKFFRGGHYSKRTNLTQFLNTSFYKTIPFNMNKIQVQVFLENIVLKGDTSYPYNITMYSNFILVYHISWIRHKKVLCNMCWQQVEEDSFIIQLDSLHIISLFFCLWG